MHSAYGEVENLEELALVLGVISNVGALPTTYLGIPLLSRHSLVTVWDGVEERFWKRLALWKRHYISKGGGLTPLKHSVKHAHLLYVSLPVA